MAGATKSALAPQGPGLGLNIDEAALARFKTADIQTPAPRGGGPPRAVAPTAR